ncbi:MAG: hypothetical protein RL641_158 [Candidatus Parcubacteria bacterium]
MFVTNIEDEDLLKKLFGDIEKKLKTSLMLVYVAIGTQWPESIFERANVIVCTKGNLKSEWLNILRSHRKEGSIICLLDPDSKPLHVARTMRGMADIDVIQMPLDFKKLKNVILHIMGVTEKT